jgi:NADPH-dependent glutamate synthase beta subunit-like oxidoreductase
MPSGSSRPELNSQMIGRSNETPFPLETSVPGVFVVGDIRSDSVKRVASAVGEGSMAVQFVHKVLAGRNKVLVQLLANIKPRTARPGKQP